MAIQRSILPPASFEDALRPIALIGQQEFKVLHEFVSKNAFELQGDQAKKLATAINIAEADLAYLFSALAFLYNRVQSSGRSPQTSEAELSKLLDNIEIDEISADEQATAKGRLTSVLKFNPNAEKMSKIRRLKTGFIDNAIDFSTFVDLRPNYIDGEIDEFIPIVQLRITTDSRISPEIYFVFQVDENGLEELEKVISRAREKLKKVTEYPPLKGKVSSGKNV